MEAVSMQYDHLGHLSVGPISYAEDNGKPVPLIMCKEYYKRASVKPSDEAYDIDAQLETGSVMLTFVVVMVNFELLLGIVLY